MLLAENDVGRHAAGQRARQQRGDDNTRAGEMPP